MSFAAITCLAGTVMALFVEKLLICCLSKNFDSKYSKNAVRLKIVDLGLKDNHQVKKTRDVYLLSLVCLLLRDA